MLRDDTKAYYLCLQKILEKELVNERYGWRNREVLKYAISNLPSCLSDKYIRTYFISGLKGERESFYPGENLTYPELFMIIRPAVAYAA